jgi:isopentenyldiphosphate isomerase
MTEEELDYFDENYDWQGVTTKAEARQKGFWVHSFHCWMMTPGTVPSMLIQKRSRDKSLFPDCLDISAAGHLSKGESIEDGVREIKEEVGLDVSFDKLISLGVKHDAAKLREIVNRQFCHVFLYPDAPSVSDLSLDVLELDGMVSMAIIDGLRLFSGEVEAVSVSGVEKCEKEGWRQIRKEVSVSDFIPRVDPYYYRMFVIADLYNKGYKYLTV